MVVQTAALNVFLIQAYRFCYKLRNTGVDHRAVITTFILKTGWPEVEIVLLLI